MPFVRVDNSGDVAILLIAGQLIRGGKQNRGLNADVLLALSLVDHHGFGLYALHAQTPLPYWLLHGLSVLALLRGIRIARSPRAALPWRRVAS